jgi:hypothetical protein
MKKRQPNQRRKPFPVLSDEQVLAIIARGKQEPWDTRAQRGWPPTTSAFDYVAQVYKKWFGRGLTRRHLVDADKPLHRHLQKKISIAKKRGRMPVAWDVPTGPEARMRAITDPEKLAAVKAVREFLRERKADSRARDRRRGSK